MIRCFAGLLLRLGEADTPVEATRLPLHVVAYQDAAETDPNG